MKNWKYHIAFFSFLLAYLCIKYSALSLPLFWDELGVYGRGIFKMYDGNWSLHPSALDPQISRGHPLLFTFLISSFLRIFGDTILVMRLGHFFFVSALLFSIYKINAHVFDHKVGILSVSILAFQPIFYAQTGLVLPELTLSLFLILALFNAYKNKMFFYFFFMSCAILTKETAIIMTGAVALYYGLHHLWNKKIFQFFYSIKYLLPIVPFVIFLQIQYQTFGWYLFPYHTSGFDLNAISIWNNLSDYCSFMFMAQGRLWISSFAIILTLIFTFKRKNNFPEFYRLVVFCSLFYLLFYSSTFYMNRYLMPIICFIFLLYGLAYHQLLLSIPAHFKNLACVVLFSVFTLAQAKYIHPEFEDIHSFKYDEDMSYMDQVIGTKQCFEYIYKNQLTDKKIWFHFPLVYGVEDPRYGYIQKGVDLNPVINLKQDPDLLMYTWPPGALPDGWKSDSILLRHEWKYKFVTNKIYDLRKKDTQND